MNVINRQKQISTKHEHRFRAFLLTINGNRPPMYGVFAGSALIGCQLYAIYF